MALKFSKQKHKTNTYTKLQLANVFTVKCLGHRYAMTVTYITYYIIFCGYIKFLLGLKITTYLKNIMTKCLKNVQTYLNTK